MAQKPKSSSRPVEHAMVMQVKMFTGQSPEQVEDKFNLWSNGTQWLSETSLHFYGRQDQFVVMKVIYGVKADEYLPPDMRKLKKPQFQREV